MTERGLSDLIGFVLVFSIILLAVGSTLTLGQGNLSEVRDDEQSRNAARAMVLLSQQFDDIEAGSASVRTGRLNVDRGTLSVDDRTDIRIAVDGDSGATLLDRTVPTRALTYELEGSTVAYESGAVVRRQAGSSRGVLRARPQFTCEDDRAYVSIVTITGDTGTSLSGGTVSVTTRLADRRVVYPRSRSGSDTAGDAANVTVEFTGLSSNSAWRWLAVDGGWETNGGATYWCDGVDSAVVRQTVAEVELLT
jgi:hypothetical protein